MTTEAFREFANTRPFNPFAVPVADGRAFVVRHPDAAALSGGGRTVSILNATGTVEVIDLLLVTSLRPLADAEAQAPRRR